MAKLPSKPKMPKESASLATWERYKARFSEWEKKCKNIKNAKAKKASLIKQLKSKVGRI
jgi:hypothetical protein